MVGNQNKKIESGHYTFSNCYMQGAPWRKQFRFFFHGAPKITKINYFCRCSLVRSWQIKLKPQQKVTFKEAFLVNGGKFDLSLFTQSVS